jgi:hypothetical protein
MVGMNRNPPTDPRSLWAARKCLQQLRNFNKG